MACVYIIRNKINDKVYVGKTLKLPRQRWAKHLESAFSRKTNFLLHKAIRKYGPSQFEITELSPAMPDTLDNLERVWILILGSFRPDIGYNQTMGGEGGVPVPEVLARKSGTNHWNYGKHWSPDVLAKMSAAKRGQPSPRKGAKHTEAAKKKLSEWRKSKTHCKHGHPFDASNTLYTKVGKRSCRTCRRGWTKASRARAKLKDRAA